MNKSPEAKKKVLILSHDKVGTSMAGPGIRYHYMAELLSKDFEVTVGFFEPDYLPEENFKRTYSVTHIDRVNFLGHFSTMNIVIAMWLSPEMITYCNNKNIFIVFDMYAPVPVENLALFLYGEDSKGSLTDYTYKQSFSMYASFFQSGDLFLVSNPRQLDFWTGYVFGTNIVDVTSYEKRPFFDRIIYSPMGIDARQAIKHTKNVLRNKIAGISEGDKILLWTGGIWNWFDGQTLIKAMNMIAKDRKDIKLVFFGTQHPNPNVPKMKEAADTYALAKSYGLLGKQVFWLDGWVPYAERINYLLEADVAVNTAKSTIEAEFSHRTRVLDHLLVGLPTVASRGDYLTDDVIETHSIGISVPPGDSEALANAILGAVDDTQNQQMRKRIEAVRADFDWQSTLSPLRDFLMNNPQKLKFVKPIEAPRPTKKYPVIVQKTKKFIPVPIKKMLLKLYLYGK